MQVRWRQRNFPIRDCGLLCSWETSPFCSSFFALLFSGERRRVFEEIVPFTSKEVKRRAPDRGVTKKPMVPVLKHICTPPRTACTNNVWGIFLGIGGTLQELTPPYSSSSDQHRLTVQIFYPLNSLNLKQLSELQNAPPWTFLNPLFFICQVVGSFCLSMLLPVSAFPLCSAVFPNQFFFSFLFSHSLPPCFLQLNKQTNPLPLDTQLRCGDLLCLSGRILSDIVAPVNKRKTPEARGVVLFVRRADYLPHTPFCLFSLSGAKPAYSMPMPGWLPCDIHKAQCLPCFPTSLWLDWILHTCII